MPTYIYLCDEELDGCGHHFELKFTFQDFDKNNLVRCPECNKVTSVHRDYRKENISGYISCRTVGSLADRNTDKYSLDYKHRLHNKHTDYLRKKEEKELPSGMKRYKRDSEGKPITSTKQTRKPRKKAPNDRKSID